MKITGLDHIAIVTKDISAAISAYEVMLGIKAGAIVSVTDQGVKSAVIAMDNSDIEIMQPIDPQSGIQKYIDKKGEGIHHVALKVDDLDEAEAHLSANGIKLIIGTANGNKSMFIHPKSTGGVLVELCEHKEQV